MIKQRKIARHTIINEETPAFFFLGVVSSEPDYRLSVMMNRHLGTDLRKCPEDIITSTTTGNHLFTRFVSGAHGLSLVSNRSEGSMLIHKLQNIDFLLVISGQHDRKKAEEMVNSVREISEVTAVFLFDSRKISDRNLTLLAAL
ncbi:MAG: IPExxxVDY family protein [Bacteroidales bacterium]|jgi:hypothetical protein|nr:IPExxxVDY family protein [Bacteroidales bacterium]